MEIDRRALLGTLAAGAAGAARAADRKPIETSNGVETIRLWPSEPPGSPPVLPASRLKKEGAPGRKQFVLRGVAAPVLFVYRPAKPNGVAIVTVPGGGYFGLSIENEGTSIANALTPLGYTVLVLSYRLPGEGWTNRADAPIQDGLRAIRVVRDRASDLRIDPVRIGMLGFSAGGHLAASVATGFDEPLYDRIDAADARSARPDFLGLLYPVTTLQKPCAEVASRRNLLGPAPDEAAIVRRSPLAHVGRTVPPCFLVHAFDDGVVNPECSLAWVAACRTAKVPIEAHFLERGGHGFGLTLRPDLPGASWLDQFQLWAKRHGG